MAADLPFAAAICPEPGALQAYLDEELPGGLRVGLATHLSECRVCQETMEENRRLTTWVEERLAPAWEVPDVNAAFQALTGRPEFQHPPTTDPIADFVDFASDLLAPVTQAVSGWLEPSTAADDPPRRRLQPSTVLAVAVPTLAAATVLGLVAWHLFHRHLREQQEDATARKMVEKPEGLRPSPASGAEAVSR